MTQILDMGGRISLVTGAGQGVGAQIAKHLAAAENSGGVAVNDFFLDRAELVADEINASGGKAVAVQADVSDRANVEDMVAEIQAKLGKVGVLVNNAGNAGAEPHPDQRKPFWETDKEIWDRTIGVNFYGVINCVGAVLPGMMERQAPGRIISIISDASRYGDLGMEIYSGAKAGAAGFMRSVARTMGRHQITANNIVISLTNTPATKAWLDDPERMKGTMSKYIIRRPGEPTDIANMALFLASNASEWISGQTYPVNGGFTLAL